MAPVKREFLGAFSVRLGTGKRLRCEIADGEPYGSAPGLYRVRVARRWQEGFFTREGLAALIASTALSGVPCEGDTPPAPRTGSVSVYFEREGELVCERGFALAPWIRAFDGQWMLLVRTPSFKGFVPRHDVRD